MGSAASLDPSDLLRLEDRSRQILAARWAVDRFFPQSVDTLSRVGLVMTPFSDSSLCISQIKICTS
jgi:hypothetical protein